MKRGCVRLLLLWSLFIAPLGIADIYQWRDAKGKIHFGDKKPEQGAAKKLELDINTYTNVSFDSSALDVGKRVVMYSTDGCGYCKKAKAYFITHDISFTEYNIDKDQAAKRRYTAMGAKGVPVILVGKKRMNGFSEEGFKRIYPQSN